MNKAILLITLTGTTLFFAQCASKKATTTGMSAEAKAAVDEAKRNYTQAQMDEGKTISMQSCNRCHKYHEPQEFTVMKWEKVLPSMTQKAKLSQDDAGKVRAYLISNAKL